VPFKYSHPNAKRSGVCVLLRTTGFALCLLLPPLFVGPSSPQDQEWNRNSDKTSGNCTYPQKEEAYLNHEFMHLIRLLSYHITHK